MVESGDLRRLVEAIYCIERGDATDGLAARWLAMRTAEQAARALAELAGRSLAAPERKTLDAITRAMLWGEPGLSDERRRAIRVAAHGLGLGVVVALLTEASPALVREEDARRVDAVLGPLTLGHRKQLARLETDPDRLSRLAGDDDAAVMRNLLLNPRMTEARVLAIAARRPATEGVLREVARSRRWGLRPQVRRALALNPYAPPSLVNPLLPLLAGPDLRDVAASDALHPAVREAALALLAARASTLRA